MKRTNSTLDELLEYVAEELAMLSNETLEQYRRMTPGQRLQLTLEMIRANLPALMQGTPEQVDRRFQLLRMQNDERNRRMREGMARTGKTA